MFEVEAEKRLAGAFGNLNTPFMALPTGGAAF